MPADVVAARERPRLTVLGGAGSFPAPGQGCSGYLLEVDGYRVVVDPGYGTLPRLLELVPPDAIDAVLVSHGHPDHCSDLNPLLRARHLGGAAPAPPLPVHAPHRALDAVLRLDRPGLLDPAVDVREFTPGQQWQVGPWHVTSALLPHWLPNAGFRLTAGSATVVYTGDCGPSPTAAHVADGADVLVADASYVDEVPAEDRAFLGSAHWAGRLAAEAGVGQLVLAHLLPGTDRRAARDAAERYYSGEVHVAAPGLTLDC